MTLSINRSVVDQMSQDPVEPASPARPRPTYDWKTYAPLTHSTLVPNEPGTFTLVFVDEPLGRYRLTVEKSIFARHSIQFKAILKNERTSSNLVCVEAGDGTRVVEIPSRAYALKDWEALTCALLDPL